MQEIYNETLLELDDLAELESYQNKRHNKNIVPASMSAFQALKKRVDHIQRTQHHHGKAIRRLEHLDETSHHQRGRNRTRHGQVGLNLILVMS